MKRWTRARLEDCAHHYQTCGVCQREGYTPLYNFHRWKRALKPWGPK